VATRQVRKRRYTNTIHRKVYCMSSRIPRQQLGRPSTPGAHRQPDRIARSDRHWPPGHGLALTSQKNGPSSRPATIALPWCRSANWWTWSDLWVWSHSDPPRTNVRPGGGAATAHTPSSLSTTFFHKTTSPPKFRVFAGQMADVVRFGREFALSSTPPAFFIRPPRGLPRPPPRQAPPSVPAQMRSRAPKRRSGSSSSRRAGA
jgi:hypothetical protein